MDIHNISFKRCINEFPAVTSTKRFTDASKVGYAAVVFLKISDGELCNVNLIFGKTCLAPIKTKLTIPRLELLAVLTWCRISQFVVNELNIKLS